MRTITIEFWFREIFFRNRKKTLFGKRNINLYSIDITEGKKWARRKKISEKYYLLLMYMG